MEGENMTTNTRLPRAWKPAWNVALGHAQTLLLCLCVASSLHGADGGPRPLPSPDAARAYRLSNADASTVASQLKTMFSECGVAAEVLIDRSQNGIVVQGSASAQQLAVQMIEALDKTSVSRVTAAAAEQRSGVKGYAVVPEKLEAVARDLTGRFPPSLGVRIAPDARTSQVVVIAPESLHADIAAYLESMPGVLADNPPAPRQFGAAGRSGTVCSTSRGASLRTACGICGVTRWSLRPSGRAKRCRSAVPRTRPVLPSCSSTAVPTTSLSPGVRIREVRGDRSRSHWIEPRNSRGGTTQLVPLHRADPEKVHEAITMIRDASLRSQPGETMATLPVSRRGASRTASGLVSMIFQPQEPAGQPAGTPPAGQPAGEPGGTPPAGQPTGEPGEAGDAPIDADAVGMLGDVQVEYIPELGVLILRGNQKDVERVQKIIAAIEQQSLVTAPVIEVVPMQHSNSESLATLITQIYGDVYQPRLGSLSITALVKPNAILFVGRKENIAAAMELVGKLDTEVPPEAQIKVFRLLHMPAVNAEQYLENFYGTTTTTGQTTQGQATVRGLSTRVTVISDFRSNSLIVQASPRDLTEVAKLLEELDVESTPATIELRVFALRNSLATDMQTVIRTALTAQAQGTQAGQFQTQQFQAPTQGQTQNQTSRSVQIVGIDQKGNKIIESGILTDVTVTADTNANSLVVRAPARSMGLVAELIEQLDKVPAAESQIKVFEITNGDATNLASMLQTLFGQQVTTGSIGAYSQTLGRTFGAGTGLVQSTAGDSSLIPLNFGVDARTNSIVVSGSAEDLAVVEAILLRLDVGDLRQRQLTVYRLNNAPAQYVAEALTQILTEQQNLLRQQQSQVFSLISQFEVIDQQVFVVPEVISNTLIVSALPKYYDQITKVIEDLDRRPPMIMIQVVVALMRLDEGEEFGAELGIQDSLLFDRGIVGTALTPGFDFANRPLGNSGSNQSLATRELLAGQAFGAFNMGRSSASEGFPGLVLSAGSESLSILIRAGEEVPRADPEPAADHDDEQHPGFRACRPARAADHGLPDDDHRDGELCRSDRNRHFARRDPARDARRSDHHGYRGPRLQGGRPVGGHSDRRARRRRD